MLMTLVVARIHEGCLSVAADTLVSEHGTALPIGKGTLKSICLPGGVCVSYSGSPELAAKAFLGFRTEFPNGASFSEVIVFFEESSKSTNNDYIVAFATPPRIVSIRDGKRRPGLSKTHWIGDKAAYERFRELEGPHRHYEREQAASAVLFADEIMGSPASDLYSTMRNVALDRSTPSVGGFITVLSNRDGGFRFSVYSDILLDWPELGEGDQFTYSTPIDLNSSGENDRYSINQISSGYYGLNAVAFYALKGRLLVAYYENADGIVGCKIRRSVEPKEIAKVLDEEFRVPFRALCLVMSSREEVPARIQRTKPSEGVGMALYCELNTLTPSAAL